RLITDPSVSERFYLGHSAMGFPFADIRTMSLAGFRSSFQPFDERQALLRKVASELARYDDDGTRIERAPPPVTRLRTTPDLEVSTEAESSPRAAHATANAR